MIVLLTNTSLLQRDLLTLLFDMAVPAANFQAGAMESFSNQAAWNNPDRYWISILTLVNWVGNVLLPLYGAGQVVLAIVHFAGLLERMTIGEAWVRNLVAAMCCFGLSGLLRLGEFWIQHGTAGVR